MITTKDLYDIIGNKITHESQKALIRNNFPQEIALQMRRLKSLRKQKKRLRADVVKDIPDYSVAVGLPAKVVKVLPHEEDSVN